MCDEVLLGLGGHGWCGEATADDSAAVCEERSGIGFRRLVCVCEDDERAPGGGEPCVDADAAEAACVFAVAMEGADEVPGAIAIDCWASAVSVGEAVCGESVQCVAVMGRGEGEAEADRVEGVGAA